MSDKVLNSLMETPTLEQLFRSFGAGGFAIALILTGFLVALLCAFLLWYRRLVRDASVRHQTRTAQAEIERLRLQNAELQKKLQGDTSPAIDPAADHVIDRKSVATSQDQPPQASIGLEPQPLREIAVSNMSEAGRADISSRTQHAAGDHVEAKPDVRRHDTLGHDTLGHDVLGLDIAAATQSGTTLATLDISGEAIEQLNHLGITECEQLQALSLEDRELLDAKLSFDGHSIDWHQLEQKVTPDGPLGIAKLEPAADPMTNSTDVSTPRTECEHGGTASASNTPDLDSAEAPVLIRASANHKDDLTLLDGIEPEQASELRKMGIVNFEQLHNLRDEQRDQLNTWFRSKGWHLDMEQWRIASEGNTLHPSTEDIQQRAFEIYQTRTQTEHLGDERTDWEQAEWELRGNPIFNFGVPHFVEDFATHYTGITPAARDELYRMGLYNKWQVEQVSKADRLRLIRWFAGPRFGVDLTQAFGWLGNLASAPTSLAYGEVFDVRPEEVDDLSQIHGLSEDHEHQLNRLGIYQFSQIANWSSENQDAISQALELDDLIARRNWVEQARGLSQA